jgi:hypothetical protein
MLRRVVPVALSLLLLSACEIPGGWENPGQGNDSGEVNNSGAPLMAGINLNLTSLNHLKTVSAYRIQEAAPATVGVTDFTPDSYRVTIASIMLMGSDGRNVAIYTGKEPVELGDQAALEAALNAEALPVEPGTYVGAQIQFGEVHAIKGSAQLGGETVYTKASSAGDAKVGPAEHTLYPTRGGSRELDFAKPVTIKAGENVKLSLVYDLTDAVNFYPQIHSDGLAYKGGEGIELKYIPFFAFVGEPPKPEIYKVTIADPDHRIEGDPDWHYQVVLFPKENGDLAGLQCIGRIDPGFDGGHFGAINFVNNKLDAHRLNPDGSYRLVGHHEGGAAFPMYEVKEFKRGDHAGKVWFFSPWDSSMTAPVELTYQATLIQ